MRSFSVWYLNYNVSTFSPYYGVTTAIIKLVPPVAGAAITPINNSASLRPAYFITPVAAGTARIFFIMLRTLEKT